MKEAHFFVYGRVQMVGYREWAVRKAASLQLSGWVRNRLDGSVEIRVRGVPTFVTVFMRDCKEGPFFARVTSLKAAPLVEGIPEIVEGKFYQKPTC